MKDTGHDMRFTLGPTDRDHETTLDVASIPSEMAGPLDDGRPSYTAPVFSQLLRSELARASRYNFLVSLLVLRILPTPEAKCMTEQEQLGELARLLNANLRTTDFLGPLGDRLVGVIAPHSDLDTAPRLLQRLQTQSLFSAFRQKTGCDLRAAFAVYPTDATTIASLVDIALQRMR